MDPVRVNGVEIPPEAIAVEMQNHPARTPEDARMAGTRALVIRELLLQEARRLGIAAQQLADDQGRRETADEAQIRALLDSQLNLPSADETACRRYYEQNRNKFRSADIYEAAHVLLSARPSDKDAYAAAMREAEAIIAVVREGPELFEMIARERSDCPSGKDGGRLGQITRGQTTPEFETFLVALEEGQLCPVPVPTPYGVHVLRLDRKIEGRILPFETVKGRIAAYLTEASWRRAAVQYVRLLAGRATIEGFDLPGADSPLVQ